MEEAREEREMVEVQKEQEVEETLQLVVIGEDATEVVENPNDDDLAEAVQMQELLFFLLQPQDVPETPQGTGTLTVATDTPIEDPIDTLIVATDTPIEELIDTLTVATDTPIDDPINPKGKQLVEFAVSYSIAERGESSKVIHENHDMFFCPICMETVQIKDGFNINPCDHIFCINCVIHYITVKTEENADSIPCPTPDCKTTSVDPTTFQHLLPKDMFDRWCLGLIESALGMKKFYCPFKDCSALLIDEGDETITNSECPHCNRMFCAKCNVSWHADMSCEEFEKLGDDEKGREDLMLKNLAKDKGWQRCAKCRMYIEKNDGCLFIKCRCGYGFCYACGTPQSNEIHYCEICRR